MESIIKALAEKIKSAIIEDLSNSEVMDIVFDAYNRYQEDEKDGREYIFNLQNQKDLLCLVKGGATAEDIVFLYNQAQTRTYYLMCTDIRDLDYLLIENYTKLKKQIICWLDEIVDSVIAYPYVEEYQKIYFRYVTNFFIG